MKKVDPIDPIALARALIRCPSVTPEDAGALTVLQTALESLGFRCTRMPFDEVDNLYARLGSQAPNFCYAGHTDVVPVGDSTQWRHNPFGGEVSDGKIWGRGASDMKGGIAAFVSAVASLLSSGWTPKGSLSFLITGDEEGPAINGTVKVLQALEARGETIDHCLVGEPTNPDTLGEMIKIGRRGSLNASITVSGIQGHVAYPSLAENPLPVLLKLLSRLSEKILDEGNEHFQPSNLEVTSVDVDNSAHNVIPERAHAKFNIRFNTEHTGDSLIEWIHDEIGKTKTGYDVQVTADLKVPGSPFITEPDEFAQDLVAVITEVTGLTPELSTSGGTSDARFISTVAPVVEFGLIGKTIHQVNEYARTADIENLSQIYKSFLIRYFAS